MGRSRTTKPLIRAATGLFAAALLAVSAPLGAREPVVAVHTVEPGQTLWSIAHGYGVRVEDLLRANSIEDPSEVAAGEELRVPSPRRNPAPAAEERPPLGLEWPVRGRLTSAYGRRGRRLHAGIDVAATSGTIVVAAAPGRVVRAGKRWGRYGIVVLVEHPGGYTTLYAHLARSFVREGDVVRAEQAVGAVGRTGNATGPHLHFEVWDGERTVDPLRFFEVAEAPMAAVLED